MAALFAPFYQLLIWGAEPAIVAIVPMSLLLVWRHEANIRKLLAGTESKLGAKAAPTPAGPLQVQEHGVHAGKHTHQHGHHGHAHGKHRKGH